MSRPLRMPRGLGRSPAQRNAVTAARPRAANLPARSAAPRGRQARHCALRRPLAVLAPPDRPRGGLPAAGGGPRRRPERARHAPRPAASASTCGPHVLTVPGRHGRVLSNRERSRSMVALACTHFMAASRSRDILPARRSSDRRLTSRGGRPHWACIPSASRGDWETSKVSNTVVSITRTSGLGTAPNGPDADQRRDMQGVGNAGRGVFGDTLDRSWRSRQGRRRVRPRESGRRSRGAGSRTGRELWRKRIALFDVGATGAGVDALSARRTAG